jgi:hypothetical protein
LPAITVAERASCVLVLLAGGVAAAELASRDHGWAGVAAITVAVLVGLIQAMPWRVSGRQRSWLLERGSDGRLHLSAPGQPTVEAQLGAGTRLLGPSVFLDLRFEMAGQPRRYCGWLTPLDVPADRLRHWSVVLPSSGRVACS